MPVSWIQHSLKNFSFILDRNLAKPNCTGNRVSASCDKVVLAWNKTIYFYKYDTALTIWYSFRNYNIWIKIRWRTHVHWMFLSVASSSCNPSLTKLLYRGTSPLSLSLWLSTQWPSSGSVIMRVGFLISRQYWLCGDTFRVSTSVSARRRRRKLLFVRGLRRGGGRCHTCALPEGSPNIQESGAVNGSSLCFCEHCVWKLIYCPSKSWWDRIHGLELTLKCTVYRIWYAMPKFWF